MGSISIASCRVIPHSDQVGSKPRRLVVVNGVPGSGKSTLAHALAIATGLPCLSKDDLKTYLMTTFSREPDPATLSAMAGELLWDLVSAMPSGAIVETWFGPTGLDAVERGCQRAGIYPDRVTEVWCELPIDVARARFLARLDSADRPTHLDTVGRDASYWQGLRDARPLGLPHVVGVRTDRALGWNTVAAVAADIR